MGQLTGVDIRISALHRPIDATTPPYEWSLMREPTDALLSPKLSPLQASNLFSLNLSTVFIDRSLGRSNAGKRIQTSRRPPPLL
jgi:hypothetical protein